MKQTFQKLQNQHPHVRARVALTIATVVTGAIGLVILTTLPFRFENTTYAGDESNAASVASAVGEATAPKVQDLQDTWQTISNFQVRQGAAAEEDAPSSQMPDEQSQDYGFPENPAQTNSNESY